MDNALKFLIKITATPGNTLATARLCKDQLDSIKLKSLEAKNALKDTFNFSSFKSGLMSIPGMAFLMNPTTLIGAGIGAVSRLGAQAESTAVAFKTLVGDEKKAGAMLKEIGDFANHSPFGKMELVEGAQQMLNFGVSTEKVLPLMKQLGDISGGNKDKFASLSLVMGQVSSTGYLMGQDLLQFINAGFNPIQELSEMTGKSVSDLKDMMSKGQITAENVAQAIAHATGEGGKFHGMMEAKSQTLEGKLSTLQDTVVTSAEELSKGINSPIGELVDQITAIIPTITNGLQLVFRAFGACIKFVMKFKTELAILGGVVVAIFTMWKIYNAALAAYLVISKLCQAATVIWTTVQWALNAAMTANPIGFVITAVVALVAAIGYAWVKFAGFRAFLITMWDTIKQFGNILKDFLSDRITDLVKGLGSVATSLYKLFKGDFKGAADSFTDGVKQISGYNAFKKAYISTYDTATNIGANFNKNLKNERAKDKAKQESKSEISEPGTKGSAKTTSNEVVFGEGKKGKGKKGKKGKHGKSAEEIATGGKRSTAITMNISKFFDTIHVHMSDKADTAELERVVVQCINRSLAIATSTDRG